jgi:hypothetical protein
MFQDLSGARAHLLLRPAAQDVQVHAAENGDAVSPTAVGILYRQDLVLKGVLAVDAHLLDEGVHQLIDVAAGMEHERLARAVGDFDDILLVRQEVATDDGRRD